MSGYVHCACRDCFDIAIASSDDETAVCHECETAGCEVDGGECQREYFEFEDEDEVANEKKAWEAAAEAWKVKCREYENT